MDLTRLAREGRTPKQNLPFGEHTLRMSYEDFRAICRLYPDIASKDPIEQSEALDRFFAGPFAEKFRVARTPTQVRRAPRDKRIIVR